MSDYELPDLPSDEELGITEDDIRALDEGGDGPGGRGASTGADGVRGEGDGQSPAGSRGRAGSHRRGILTLSLLVAMGWVSSIRTGLPGPEGAAAPDTVFSAERAMADLREIARAPRPPGSPEHDRVRGWLVDRLTAMGLEPQIQTSAALVERGGSGRVATVRNVWARLAGSDPTGAVVLTAHYDGVPGSPAAGDDASGVVTVLEAARALQAGPAPANDVLLLFTDAEELGLLGARAFVRDQLSAHDVGAVVGLEMRGSSGPSILFETATPNAGVIASLRRFDAAVFGNSMGEEFFRYMPHGTDFTVFEEAGIGGLNFAAIDNAAVYHTPRDLPSELSLATLQQHGEHALGAVRALGAVDLSAESGGAGEVVYFTLPVLGMVSYGERWVRPLGVVLVLVAVGTFFLALRRGARPAAVTVGFGAAIVATALGYGAGEALATVTRPWHPESGHLPAALYYGEGWYVLGLGAMALALVAGLFAATRRRISVVEWVLGALVMPLAGATALAFTLPLAAMTFQWPVAATLVLVATLSLLGSRAGGRTGWFLSLVLSVPVIAFFVPAAEFLWLAGTFRLTGPLGALMVTGLLLALPILATLSQPSRGWAPLLALAVAAACFGLGRLGAGVSPLTPLPTTLVYVWDHDTGEAIWASDSLTVRGTGPWERASTWLAERAGGDFGDRRDLSGVGYLRGPVPVSAAAPPVTAAAAPSVELRETSVAGGIRRVTLAVGSRVGAEMMHIARDPGPRAARIVAVAGQRVSDPFALRTVEHWGRPDSALVLELELPVDGRVDLRISEHHLRPSELLGAGVFQRPPGLQAHPRRLSDRVILTTRYVAERGAMEPLLGRPEPGEPVPDTSGATRPDSPSAPVTDSLGAGAREIPVTPIIDSLVAPSGDSAVAPSPDTAATGGRAAAEARAGPAEQETR